MKEKKEISFEEAFCRLKEMAEKIKEQDSTLKESMECYEEGMNYYRVCNEILENAKQKIEVFEGEV